MLFRHVQLHLRGLWSSSLRAATGLGTVVIHELGVLSLGTLTSLGPSWAVRALATSLDVDLGQSGTVGASVLLLGLFSGASCRSSESRLLALSSSLAAASLTAAIATLRKCS